MAKNKNDGIIDGAGIGSDSGSGTIADAPTAGGFESPIPGASTDGESAAPRKRRGRKAGEKTGPRKAKEAAIDLNILNHALFVSHLFFSEQLQAPELALTEKQAKSLAESIVEVSKYYEVAVSAKAQAWGMLLLTAGSIYGSKIVAISRRKKAEKAQHVQTPY